MFLVDEAYTSQTCPCCQRRKKVRLRRTLGHSRCPQHFGKRTVRKDVSYPGRNEEKVFVDCVSKK
ncbi:transposase [Bacillus toyonensis]|uniref:transposase n=1 Tax=Bacillus toyonensis TaxID=155322 RepID=UPI001E3F6946|nr:transposase [Bacillus toyonensis]